MPAKAVEFSYIWCSPGRSDIGADSGNIIQLFDQSQSETKAVEVLIVSKNIIVRITSPNVEVYHVISEASFVCIGT